MKNYRHLFTLGISILLFSSFFIPKKTKNEDSPIIKSIGIREEIFLSEPLIQPNEPFSPEMISYFNEFGTEDSTLFNTNTGEKVIKSYNVYDKNNRLDTIYYFLRGRVKDKVEIFEYNKKNNFEVKTVSLPPYENKYFYNYNTKNELIELIGFNTSSGTMDTIHWHKYKYDKGVLIEDANLFDVGKWNRKIRYNENGDEAKILLTKQINADGKVEDRIINISKKYKYNTQGDWVACLSQSHSTETVNGTETYFTLIRREIEYY